jgi:lipid-A-disaccharide synthase
MPPDEGGGFCRDRRNFNIMIVAGEASGDLHGAYLMRAMKERQDVPLSFYGIGGDKMAKEGMQLMADAADMAVMGLTEVISRLWFIRKIMKRLKRSLENERPDLVILIDYPGFNLALAKEAQKKGIAVLYYISPKVWAWRSGRIKTIKQVVNHIALIFPFEEELYRKAGVKGTFVGHPLLDEIQIRDTPEEIKKEMNLSGAEQIVALLPGSRKSEIQKLLPEMIKAAEILHAHFPGMRFTLPVAHTLSVSAIQDSVASSAVPVQVVAGKTYEILSVADAVIVASGTAALETALFAKPMVIVYKTSSFTYFLGKRLVKTKHIGLPNILAQKTIVPELIQKDFSGERIAYEVTQILKNQIVRDKMIQELTAIKKSLGEPGAARRTAALAWQMLQQDK